jgi:hypothetical protein
MFTDGERVERKIIKRRKRMCGTEMGPLLHSLSNWVSAYSTAKYTLAIPNGEFFEVYTFTNQALWMKG